MTGPNPSKSGGYWKVAYRDHAGRRRWKSLGPIAGTTKIIAKRKALAFYESLALTPGKRDATKAPALKPWTEAYLELRRPDVSDGTLTLDGHTIAHLLAYFGDDTRVDRITPAAADDWRAWLLDEHQLKPATVASHIRRAKVMFERLADRGEIQRNPFSKLPSSVKAPEKVCPVTEAMIQPILDACPSPAWKALFALCAYGGLRLGEALAIRWTDIQWDKGRIVVANIKTAHTTGEARRQVRMEKVLEQILLDCQESANDARVCPVSTSNLHRNADTIIARAGFTPYPKPFHAWRSWRSTSWKAVYPEHVVDAWLGHSKTVARSNYNTIPDEYYGQVSPHVAQLLAEIERLKNALIHQDKPPPNTDA